ncbi:FUSC family protein [Gordonia zhaorongruii]|uniref:FUSC family protein n=1 Tax=Gordonia zhaorongruii TaxID=2597659 RepID=UPI0010458567|nr:FUSC family protein [Gordonia zhaorongruii]
MTTRSDAPSADRTAPSRAAALAHPMRAVSWRSALAVDLSKAGYAVPLRVGIAVGLVLIAGGLLGMRDIAGFAALGALVSAFCRADPYRIRVGRLIALGIGLTLSTAVGGVVGLSGGGLATETVAVSLLAGVAAIFIGALRIAGPGAVVFVFAAAAAAGFVHDLTDLGRAMAAAAIGGVLGAVASLAPWLYAHARRALANGPAVPEPDTSAYDSVLRALSHGGQRYLLAIAGRMMIASAASAVIAAAIGLDHPMWAAMGAIAALQGVDFHVTVSRGIARLIGNITGAAIAAGLLALPLGYWGAVVAIIVFQTIAEITAPINYAICSTAVTPMALLLTALGAGLSPAAAVDRIADTLIGIVVGIIVAALTISATDHLPGSRLA